MKIIAAIMKKQIKDTLKNKTVLIQFVMFPMLAIIMNFSIKIENMPENFFVNLFAAMYVGMAPLTAMAAIVSEEKEKNTLRVLMLSKVKPAQYLTAIGGYIFFICMMGAAVFCIAGKYKGSLGVNFMAVMAVGIIVSIMTGAVIGCGCKNQMSATSVTVPVMMVFSFLPMLSMFNDTIKKIAKFTYSQQISILISKLGEGRLTGRGNLGLTMESFLVILLNFLISFVVFCLVFHKAYGSSSNTI